jgi:hypothetical protein
MELPTATAPSVSGFFGASATDGSRPYMELSTGPATDAAQQRNVAAAAVIIALIAVLIVGALAFVLWRHFRSGRKHAAQLPADASVHASGNDAPVEMGALPSMDITVTAPGTEDTDQPGLGRPPPAGRGAEEPGTVS